MKKKVLVVDDSAMILKLLNIILSNDYEVEIKTNGIDALHWLEEGNFPDLIISDLMMPYFDGLSFVRNLKISGYYKDTPVIVLSAAEDIEEQINSMGVKVDGYIKKPFNPSNLKSIIQDVFSNTGAIS
jgi:two-component system, chemotaxis family, chemotaxis protein CheY